jgi:hypothetical protein
MYSQMKYKSSFTASNYLGNVASLFLPDLKHKTAKENFEDISSVWNKISVYIKNNVVFWRISECIPFWLADRDVHVAESPVGCVQGYK